MLGWILFGLKAGLSIAFLLLYGDKTAGKATSKDQTRNARPPVRCQLTKDQARQGWSEGATSWAAPWRWLRAACRTPRTRLVLREVVGAGVLHFQHALGAVGAHAGQHHAERVLARRAGGRPEQHLDRGPVAVDRLAVATARRCSWRPSARRSRCECRPARCRRGPAARVRRRSASLTRIRHRPSRRLRERLGEARRHVLRDQHCRRIGRQRHQHFADRFGAAGGRADDDQLFGRQQRAAQMRRGGRRRGAAAAACACAA